MHILTRSSLILFALSIATTTFGQAGGGREALYRCKDAAGNLWVGSAMPPECQGIDTEVLNQRGSVVRMIEGAATQAKRLAEEAVAAQALKERNDQSLRDRVLIDTYLTVDDIVRLRDQRLDLVGTQLSSAEQHIVTLKDRIARLRQQSARFKPYADKPNAPPLPDHLAEEIVNTIKSLEVDQQTIDIKRAEQVTMTANFERDIKRFKELKGIK